MMSQEELDRADSEAKIAKERLFGSLEDARSRLAPGALKQEATERSMDYALDQIARGKTYASGHPFQLVGLGLVLGAIVARQPLTALFRRMIVEGKEKLFSGIGKEG